MALLIVYDAAAAAAAIQEQTLRRQFLLTISEGKSVLVLLGNMVRVE